jgi:hypothetical protein
MVKRYLAVAGFTLLAALLFYLSAVVTNGGGADYLTGGMIVAFMAFVAFLLVAIDP